MLSTSHFYTDSSSAGKTLDEFCSLNRPKLSSLLNHLYPIVIAHPLIALAVSDMHKYGIGTKEYARYVNH